MFCSGVDISIRKLFIQIKHHIVMAKLKIREYGIFSNRSQLLDRGSWETRKRFMSPYEGVVKIEKEGVEAREHLSQMSSKFEEISRRAPPERVKKLEKLVPSWYTKPISMQFTQAELYHAAKEPAVAVRRRVAEAVRSIGYYSQITHKTLDVLQHDTDETTAKMAREIISDNGLSDAITRTKWKMRAAMLLEPVALTTIFAMMPVVLHKCDFTSHVALGSMGLVFGSVMPVITGMSSHSIETLDDFEFRARTLAFATGMGIVSGAAFVGAPGMLNEITSVAVGIGGTAVFWWLVFRNARNGVEQKRRLAQTERLHEPEVVSMLLRELTSQKDDVKKDIALAAKQGIDMNRIAKLEVMLAVADELELRAKNGRVELSEIKSLALEMKDAWGELKKVLAQGMPAHTRKEELQMSLEKIREEVEADSLLRSARPKEKIDKVFGRLGFAGIGLITTSMTLNTVFDSKIRALSAIPRFGAWTAVAVGTIAGTLLCMPWFIVRMNNLEFFNLERSLLKDGEKELRFLEELEKVEVEYPSQTKA